MLKQSGVLKRPMVFQADDEGGQILQAQCRSTDRDDRVLEIDSDAVDRDARRDRLFQITEEPGPGKRALGDQVVGKDNLCCEPPHRRIGEVNGQQPGTHIGDTWTTSTSSSLENATIVSDSRSSLSIYSRRSAVPGWVYS